MMGETAFDLTPVLAEFILFVGALILLVVGAFREKDGARLITPFAVLIMLIAAAVTIGLDKGPTLAMGGHVLYDEFAAFLKVLILLGAAAGLLLAQGYLDDHDLNRFEYPMLALFSTLGMCMMVSANSFVALYMALELQSLALYVMAAFHRDNLRSTEAGLKYFVLGALASGMLLYGCSLVYGFTGTLHFSVLTEQFMAENAVLPLGALVGLIFIICGLAFKLSAVPFHMWAPDVYEGAPTPVTAFFAAAPKVAAIGLTLRILAQPFGEWTTEWQQVIVFISIASMLLGAFAAITQTNIKRLMAYSGIGHMGYALVGISAGTNDGVRGVLIYMAIYLVTTLGTFACILTMRRKGRYVETIADLAGLSKTAPMTALALTVFMFSLAGIPPLAGFIGKYMVFMAAIEAGLFALAVIGVLASVVGCYYYLRIVKLMYFDEAAEPFDGRNRLELGAIASIATILVLGFMFMPGLLLPAAQAAASSLIGL